MSVPEGLMTVVEVGRRTGVTRKALRLYEEMGLIRPVERTEAGYRLYDDETLRRLQLITRAKSLGLTLNEAEHFLDVADDCCGQDLSALEEIVERKLAQTNSRRQELAELTANLEAVLVRLTKNKGRQACEETLCTCNAAV